MELRAFNVGDTVMLAVSRSGLPAGTVMTISNIGGTPPLDMTLSQSWTYSATTTSSGMVYSVTHRDIVFASREARLKSLRDFLGTIKKLEEKTNFTLEKVEKYKDDGDYIAHKIVDAIKLDAKHTETIRKIILKYYPSEYKFTD